MKNPDGSPITVAQANRERRCLVCGVPNARLLRHPDGRYLRACVPCLNSPLSGDWSRSEERDPLPCEEVQRVDHQDANRG